VRKIWLIDSTLRDGEQAPRVAFPKEGRLKVARLLDALGVDEIEAGTPAMGEDEQKKIRAITSMHLQARIAVWCRATKEDISVAADTRAEGVHIAFPVSDIQLAAMNKDWAWVKEAIPARLEQAHAFFPFVSIGAQDAGRCEAGRLVEFMDMAVRYQAPRVRVADTVGMLTPVATMELIQRIHTAHPFLQIDFHGHNDFGMATANALSAWQAGASALSVTVNGLGERAGNAALEEVVMVLSQLFGQTQYATERLAALCRYVAELSGRPIPVGKPVSGEYAFSHESGIHAKGSLADVRAFQPFDGRLVGRESCRNVFGTHSGKGAVTALLKQYGMVVEDKLVPGLIQIIHTKAEQNEGRIEACEIISIYNVLLKDYSDK
jgi:homocitrate synthase NifV